MSVTHTLLLRCAGPMQSWGTRSRFDYRDTEREPSKSGVIGLLAAALGREREDDISDLAALSMAVRLDRPGHVETDYHTVLEVARASGSKGGTAVTRRDYLADACFLVGLSGEPQLLSRCQAALGVPRFPLFLGRRGFAPSPPVQLPDGLSDIPILEAIKRYHWPADSIVGGTAHSRSSETAPHHLDVVVECEADEPGDERWDVPVSFAAHDRRFASRRVRRVRIDRPGWRDV